MIAAIADRVAIIIVVVAIMVAEIMAAAIRAVRRMIRRMAVMAALRFVAFRCMLRRNRLRMIRLRRPVVVVAIDALEIITAVIIKKIK